ncbi:MAG TPA: hypothetical protein VF755_16100, partial [Catenuloplanes sp.]
RVTPDPPAGPAAGPGAAPPAREVPRRVTAGRVGPPIGGDRPTDNASRRPGTGASAAPLVLPDAATPAPTVAPRNPPAPTHGYGRPARPAIAPRPEKSARATGQSPHGSPRPGPPAGPPKSTAQQRKPGR